MGRLFLFYARDDEEAEDQATHILTVFPHLVREKLHLQPYGFMLIYGNYSVGSCKSGKNGMP